MGSIEMPHTMSHHYTDDHDHVTLLQVPHGLTILNQVTGEHPSPPYSHSVEPEEYVVRVSIDSYGGNWVNDFLIHPQLY